MKTKIFSVCMLLFCIWLTTSDEDRPCLNVERSYNVRLGWYVLQGELETVQAFQNDLYGCKDPIKSKRAERDPFGFGGDVGVQSCPALKPFLAGCPSSRYTGNLPWRMSNRLTMFATNI